MIEFDPTLVNWSRAQFALTACFHFIFVPLTLGLSVMLAIMETIYYRTRDENWKKTCQFWMKLFGINFAIGVATGIILEFEIGTNWSNFSWFVGDIFGAPLAIEGIFAFFLEATFFAVMFFGWQKVSPKMHLFATWMVAVGSALSALWILVANGWMQYPVGTQFNIDLARHEMVDFFAIFLSPVSAVRFMHTLGGAYVTSALFVLGISAYYLLRNRHIAFARKSMSIAVAFGLLSALYVAMIGDQSGYVVAQKQPMKLAAAEGLYQGERGAGIIAFGFPNWKKQPKDSQPAVFGAVKIPYLLSQLGHRNPQAFVPGIDDLLYGNPEEQIEGAKEKIRKGKIALRALEAYHQAKENKDEQRMYYAREAVKKLGPYMGYGHFDEKHLEELVPNFPTTFLSFHLMVALGVYFILLFAGFFWLHWRGKIGAKKWPLQVALWSWPLGLIAMQAGWVMAEMGRQPWVVQDLLPTKVGASNLGAGNVMFTFFGLAILFTLLFVVEVRIMVKAIQQGPQE